MLLIYFDMFNELDQIMFQCQSDTDLFLLQIDIEYLFNFEFLINNEIGFCLLDFINKIEETDSSLAWLTESYSDNLNNLKNIYHYSIPTVKLFYPEPFIAAASFMHSDL